MPSTRRRRSIRKSYRRSRRSYKKNTTRKCRFSGSRHSHPKRIEKKHIRSSSRDRRQSLHTQRVHNMEEALRHLQPVHQYRHNVEYPYKRIKSPRNLKPAQHQLYYY